MYGNKLHILADLGNTGQRRLHTCLAAAADLAYLAYTVAFADIRNVNYKVHPCDNDNLTDIRRLFKGEQSSCNNWHIAKIHHCLVASHALSSACGNDNHSTVGNFLFSAE